MQRPHRTVLLATCADEAILRERLRARPDVLLLELEDGVPKASKAEARARAIQALKTWEFGGTERWVRINAINSVEGMRDLVALPEGRPEALMPTKVRTPEEIICADYVLSRREEELGLEAGSIRLCPMIETGLAILNLRQIISASRRINGVLLGSEDLSVDIGFARTEGGSELEWVRTLIVMTAHSLGVECFDVASLRVDDAEALFREARHAYELGFDGKGCIASPQVDTVHRAFAPAQAQVDWARRVLGAKLEADRLKQAEFSLDGRTIEQPTLLQAAGILRRAGLAS